MACTDLLSQAIHSSLLCSERVQNFGEVIARLHTLHTDADLPTSPAFLKYPSGPMLPSLPIKAGVGEPESPVVYTLLQAAPAGWWSTGTDLCKPTSPPPTAELFDYLKEPTMRPTTLFPFPQLSPRSVLEMTLLEEFMSAKITSNASCSDHSGICLSLNGFSDRYETTSESGGSDDESYSSCDSWDISRKGALSPSLCLSHLLDSNFSPVFLDTTRRRLFSPSFASSCHTYSIPDESFLDKSSDFELIWSPRFTETSTPVGTLPSISSGSFSGFSTPTSSPPYMSKMVTPIASPDTPQIRPDTPTNMLSAVNQTYIAAAFSHLPMETDQLSPPQTVDSYSNESTPESSPGFPQLDWQETELYTVFNKRAYLSASEKQKLATKLDISANSVQKWFKNARRRRSREQQRRLSGHKDPRSMSLASLS